MRHQAWIIALALVTLAGAAASAPPAGAALSADHPVVTTSDGTLTGSTQHGMIEFLGVPYAAPPVGALRWRPPQPPAHWSGDRDATAYGPHCAQPGLGSLPASTSEDCLYLNVFAPADQTGTHPVMVWIHGGALVSGESDYYDPTRLVADGVVVVTIDYRLGVLGFLAHPALAARPGGPAGNYGLMDQQAALRWVRDNIAEFTGDPRNVTLFGESAGGLSTLAQLASPGARGLFGRAIVESGSYNAVQATLAQAETAGETFAAKAGCADQTAACLRRLPVATILADQDSGYTPDVDGQVLTRQLSASFTSGRFNHMPVLDGTNHDEFRYDVGTGQLAGTTVTAANYPTTIATILQVSPTLGRTIAAQYPLSAYPSPQIALGAVGTDAFYACHALTIDRTLSRFVPTYAYEFNDENSPYPFLPPLGFPYGAAHIAETLYLFDYQSPFTVDQQALADTMQRDWTGFAAHGAPTDGPAWPRFASNDEIESLIPPRPTVETDFATAHHCAFWQPLDIP